MRFLFVIFVMLLITKLTFPQQRKTFISKDSSKQYNNTGSGQQVINNNYYTMNNNYNYQLTPKENAINATRGFFKKRKDTSSKSPVIVLGTETFHDVYIDAGSRSEPKEQINAYRVKGQILINAVIRDSKGDEVAHITGNTWEITNTQSIEYNNDENGLEIRSGKDVIFQINITKDTVFCYGMLCNDKGQCSYYAPNEPFTTPFKIQDATQRFVLPDDYDIPPLFEYPRFENLGVRAKHS